MVMMVMMMMMMLMTMVMRMMMMMMIFFGYFHESFGVPRSTARGWCSQRKALGSSPQIISPQTVKLGNFLARQSPHIIINSSQVLRCSH